MLKDLFRKPKYATINADTVRKEIPEGLWQKCPECSEILYSKELEKSMKTCKKCGYQFRMGAWERIRATVDEGSFQELDTDLSTTNPLGFQNYTEKIAGLRETTKLNEAILTGEATINGYPVVIGVMDASFIMGSMGAVVGEKVARAIEKAIAIRVPLIIFAASGGARMQEGIISLMQMAKTCAALSKLNEEKLLYITVLTDPTTGGVTASFASMGDIILAEPGALIGFTGPRVIEQTIRQKLPEGFQTSEFLMQHGFVDLVVPREQMKTTLANIIELHSPGGAKIG